jgi:hypothetical protein
MLTSNPFEVRASITEIIISASERGQMLWILDAVHKIHRVLNCFEKNRCFNDCENHVTWLTLISIRGVLQLPE